MSASADARNRRSRPPAPPPSPASPPPISWEASCLHTPSSPTRSSRPIRGGRKPPRVRALDGLTVEVARRDRVRPARPERRRQVHHRQDPLHAVPAGRRERATSPASTSCAEPDAVRHAIGLVSQKPSSDPMATGRENLVLAARIQGLSARRRPGTRPRAARPVRPRRRRRPARQDLVRRDGPQARRRDRARAPPAGAVPRRAHHRPRPRGARGDVGRDRPAVGRRAGDGAADHALPRRGRPPRRPARDRRPRPGRGRGHARRAQERAARRRGRRGTRLRADAAGAARARCAGLGLRDVVDRGEPAAGPGGRRGARRPRRARRAGRGRDAGVVGDRRPTVPRRRLPAHVGHGTHGGRRGVAA